MSKFKVGDLVMWETKSAIVVRVDFGSDNGLPYLIEWDKGRTWCSAGSITHREPAQDTPKTTFKPGNLVTIVVVPDQSFIGLLHRDFSKMRGDVFEVGEIGQFCGEECFSTPTPNGHANYLPTRLFRHATAEEVAVYNKTKFSQGDLVLIGDGHVVHEVTERGYLKNLCIGNEFRFHPNHVTKIEKGVVKPGQIWRSPWGVMTVITRNEHDLFCDGSCGRVDTDYSRRTLIHQFPTAKEAVAYFANNYME